MSAWGPYVFYGVPLLVILYLSYLQDKKNRKIEK